MKKPVIRSLGAVLIAAAAIGICATPVHAAAKKKVNVVVSIYHGKKMSKKTLYETCKYQKNGLLKSGQRMNGIMQMEYTYDKKNRITQFRRAMNEWATFDYTYDRKGRIKKVNGYYTHRSDNTYAYDGLDSVYTYNTKNQIIKEKVTGFFWDNELDRSVKKTYTNKFSYDKKGRLSRLEVPAWSEGHVETLKYDKNGYPVKFTWKESGGYHGTETYVNTYAKNGTLTCSVGTMKDGDDTITTKIWYKYKTIKVDAALAPLVKAQQRQFFVSKDFAVPVNDYNGM